MKAPSPMRPGTAPSRVVSYRPRTAQHTLASSTPPRPPTVPQPSSKKRASVKDIDGDEVKTAARRSSLLYEGTVDVETLTLIEKHDVPEKVKPKRTTELQRTIRQCFAKKPSTAASSPTATLSTTGDIKEESATKLSPRRPQTARRYTWRDDHFSDATRPTPATSAIPHTPTTRVSSEPRVSPHRSTSPHQQAADNENPISTFTSLRKSLEGDDETKRIVTTKKLLEDWVVAQHIRATQKRDASRVLVAKGASQRKRNRKLSPTHAVQEGRALTETKSGVAIALENEAKQVRNKQRERLARRATMLMKTQAATAQLEESGGPNQQRQQRSESIGGSIFGASATSASAIEALLQSSQHSMLGSGESPERKAQAKAKRSTSVSSTVSGASATLAAKMNRIHGAHDEDSTGAEASGSKVLDVTRIYEHCHPQEAQDRTRIQSWMHRIVLWEERLKEHFEEERRNTPHYKKWNGPPDTAGGPIAGQSATEARRVLAKYPSMKDYFDEESLECFESAFCYEAEAKEAYQRHLRSMYRTAVHREQREVQKKAIVAAQRNAAANAAAARATDRRASVEDAAAMIMAAVSPSSASLALSSQQQVQQLLSSSVAGPLKSPGSTSLVGSGGTISGTTSPAVPGLKVLTTPQLVSLESAQVCGGSPTSTHKRASGSMPVNIAAHPQPSVTLASEAANVEYISPRCKFPKF